MTSAESRDVILNSTVNASGVPFVTVTKSLEIAEGVTYWLNHGGGYASGSYVSGAYGLFGLRDEAVGSAATGFIQAKELSELATQRTDGKIPVTLENLPTDFTSGSIAVCTVPAAVAEATCEKLALNHLRGAMGTFRVGETADGLRTIFLDVEHQGLLLIFR